jgi:cellulose synthase/poly-beta-1,6-N-acetylglucosamine synthase-like glycosyltransferase
MGLGLGAGTAIHRAPPLHGAAVPPMPRMYARGWPKVAARSGSPELACLRGLLTADVLSAAERRARKLGVGADRVLITTGHVSEEAYVRALAASLGVAFEPLERVPRLLCPLEDDRLIECLAVGLLPLSEDADLTLVVAPRNMAARRLTGLIGARPELAPHFRFTTAERLNRFVLRYASSAIIRRATEHLRRARPAMCACNARGRWSAALPAVLALAGLAGPVLVPSAVTQTFALTLSGLFLAWLSLRLAVPFAATPMPKPQAHVRDDMLPVYTIIAALYNEAASVSRLLSAIERIDYPAEKLDVILAVEADDNETRAAIAAHKTRLPILVVVVPAGGPRTKPKALNVALPFARGTFTVIYDAEDNPEPGQLRRSLQSFRRGGDKLACLQASLCIDNTADGWLTRMCTAEYAGQFDVFLPGLAALRLPVPLGGSSNHFRTDTLRKVGGWDAYNVTEDADLGIRLARLGYCCGTIDATTYEEAPVRFGAWLRQRTRWFKGWMQTWLTHMQAPRTLFRDLGAPGFLTFHLIVGGSALAALVHPLFWSGLFIACFSGALSWNDDGLAILALYGLTAAAGYLVSGIFGWLGLSRRGLSSTAWVLALTPVHWLLLSLAAWRALCQLFVAPHRWEKTEHGLARSSRVNPVQPDIPPRRRNIASRTKLSDYCSPRARDTCADPSPLPRASASD